MDNDSQTESIILKSEDFSDYVEWMYGMIKKLQSMSYKNENKLVYNPQEAATYEKVLTFKEAEQIRTQLDNRIIDEEPIYKKEYYIIEKQLLDLTFEYNENMVETERWKMKCYQLSQKLDELEILNANMKEQLLTSSEMIKFQMKDIDTLKDQLIRENDNFNKQSEQYELQIRYMSKYRQNCNNQAKILEELKIKLSESLEMNELFANQIVRYKSFQRYVENNCKNLKFGFSNSKKIICQSVSTIKEIEDDVDSNAEEYDNLINKKSKDDEIKLKKDDKDWILKVDNCTNTRRVGNKISLKEKAFLPLLINTIGLIVLILMYMLVH